MTSGKYGINLGASNASTNYFHIVIPTGLTNYAINVSNTFTGASVAYVDVGGNATFQRLNCTQLSVTYSIILPTTYTSAPTAGYLGYVKPQVQFASQALTTAVLLNMGAVTLTQGIWDV